jgi:hypothetical protein
MQLPALAPSNKQSLESRGRVGGEATVVPIVYSEAVHGLRWAGRSFYRHDSISTAGLNKIVGENAYSMCLSGW